MLRGHEEVGGLGWMMRGLFSNIVAFRLVAILPIASECLAQDGIQGLLNSATSVLAVLPTSSRWAHTVV
jgi:hypothetical protein